MAKASEKKRKDPDLFINRELSWLDFNDRVLQLAEDERVRLLERAFDRPSGAAQPCRAAIGPPRRRLVINRHDSSGR